MSIQARHLAPSTCILFQMIVSARLRSAFQQNCHCALVLLCLVLERILSVWVWVWVWVGFACSKFQVGLLGFRLGNAHFISRRVSKSALRF